MKYNIHIEADVILDFEPGDMDDTDAYAEQVAYDCVHKPYYEQGVKIDWITVDASRDESKAKP